MGCEVASHHQHDGPAMMSNQRGKVKKPKTDRADSKGWQDGGFSLLRGEKPALLEHWTLASMHPCKQRGQEKYWLAAALLAIPPQQFHHL
jgi:hypothetical protein